MKFIIAKNRGRMRWFKHLNDFRNTPEFLAIRRELGIEPGYGRAMLLMELVTQHGDSGRDFRAEFALTRTMDTAWLALEFGVTKSVLSKTLEVFVRIGFMDPEAWKKQIIKIPVLMKLKDEWSRKHSGASQEHS